MGTVIKHNAILKLTHDEGMPYQLNVGERYYFRLDGLRIFQLYPTLITLVHEINEKWKYAGLVQIMQQTIDAESNFTTGEFVISRIFDEEFSRAASLNEAPAEKSYYENQQVVNSR